MNPLSRALSVLFTTVLFFSSNAFTQTDRYIVLEGTTALAHVYNASDNAEVASIKVGNTPAGAVLSGNGRLAFIANLNSEYVSVVDLTIQAEIRRIRGVRFGQLALMPGGSTVIGADFDDSKLKLIDAATFNITQTFDLNGQFGDDPSNPFDLTFGSPVIAGNKVYLNTDFGIGAVDLGTGSVALVSTTTFGRNTFNHNLAGTADGKFVVAARGGGLEVIDPVSNAVVRSLPGFFACVAASNNSANPDVVLVVRSTGGGTFLSSLDVSTGQFLADVPLPQAFADTRTDITMNADGSRAYVGATATNPDVAVIDTTLNAVVAQFNVGVRAVPAAAGLISLQPAAGAPVVTAVSPELVVNNADSVIQISGSGFASGAQVRVGTLDPIAAQVTSASQLQVTVPKHAAAQGAPIIVTTPDLAQGVAGAQQSGILRNAFVIATPPTFQPVNQVAVPNSAESTFAVLNVSTNTTLAPAIPTGTRPLGLAILPDGSRAFIEDLFAPAAIDIYNFASNSIETHLVLNSASVGFPGQTRGIALAPIFGTGTLAAYVDVSHPVAGGFSVDVDVIGADPAASGFETVVATIPTGSPNPTSTPGPIAVTPDGHYAFIQTFQRGVSNDVNFIVLDLNTGVSKTILGSTFGFTGFQPNFELSSDGKFLVVEPDSGLLAVLDIGTDPFNPTIVKTVGTVPPGGFLLPRVVGSRLYAFDPSRDFVDIFNFNPAAGDFSELGNFSFSGSGSPFGNTFDVTPDGNLIYLPLREEDAVAVVDANKVIAQDPTALVTKIGTGISPSSLAVRPGTPTPVGTNVPVQPTPEVSLNFSGVSTAGVTSATTTNTNPDPLPVGFSLGTPPVYYEISTTAVFTPPVQVCIGYNPAQFPGPEANIRLLHDEGGTFVDVTTSLDMVNHVVCGSVSHFSAFTVGLATVDFFFHTLLSEINSAAVNQSEQQSLAAKVQAAQASFDRGHHQTAANQLNAFENEVHAQTGKSLTAAEASRLLQLAGEILARL